MDNKIFLQDEMLHFAQVVDVIDNNGNESQEVLLTLRDGSEALISKREITLITNEFAEFVEDDSPLLN